MLEYTYRFPVSIVSFLKMLRKELVLLSVFAFPFHLFMWIHHFDFVFRLEYRVLLSAWHEEGQRLIVFACYMDIVPVFLNQGFRFLVVHLPVCSI